jgi:hypothetical protein
VAIRSSGWSVTPSFVPHGPTTNVTLVADDRALTQLAGVPDVAWQTPWSELHDVELSRRGRQMSLAATADGVRYLWTKRDLEDFEAWREVVLGAGGEVARRPRRAAALIGVAAVLVASFAGGIAALFTSTSGPSQVTVLKSVNLTRDDLPRWFAVSSASPLTNVVGRPGQVVTATPTTIASATSAWGRIGRRFATCLGVPYARDRMFGPAAQQPLYQVASPVFSTTSLGVIQVASTAQYYRSTDMVRRDRAEMSTAGFGACFADANADILATTLTGAVSSAPATGVAWSPATYLGGWVRAGEVSVDLTGVGGPLTLVAAVVAEGHYEVTLTALVGDFAESERLLAQAVSTLQARITSSSATAA